MVNKNYSICLMTKSDMETAVNWAAEEGWNPGINDAECFYNADPSGFFISKINNQPVAAISAVKYQKAFAFIGFYIVKPEYRGRGYGWQIWQHAMKSLEGYTIGLDGVVEHIKDYQTSGFVLACNNIRYQGVSHQSLESSCSISKLSKADMVDILQYDNLHFPAERKEFLNKWLFQDDHISFKALENEDIKGYGTIRKCREGYKIGPLFADNPNIAEQLFLKMISAIPHQSKYFLDIPAPNKAAEALVRKYQMQPVFQTARMYKNGKPQLPLKNIYGITSFELG